MPQPTLKSLFYSLIARYRADNPDFKRRYTDDKGQEHASSADVVYALKHIKQVASDAGVKYSAPELVAVARAANTDNDKYIINYLPETFNNELKYNAYGLKPLVNGVVEGVTLGFGPKWSYGYNANDQYLTPEMIKTREGLLTVGETAISLITPMTLAKGLRAVPHAAKVVQWADAPMKFNTWNPVVHANNSGKFIFGNLLLDTGNNIRLGRDMFAKGNRLKTTLALLGESAGAYFDGSAQYKEITNNGRMARGELTPVQWLELGVLPSYGKMLVETDPTGWQKRLIELGVPEDALKDMQSKGTVKPKDNTNGTSEPPEESKPWYHNPAVGIGAGVLGGSLTGYGVAHAMDASATSKLLAALGGGTIGGVLGKVIQDKILKR